MKSIINKIIPAQELGEYPIWHIHVTYDVGNLPILISLYSFTISLLFFFCRPSQRSHGHRGKRCAHFVWPTVQLRVRIHRGLLPQRLFLSHCGHNGPDHFSLSVSTYSILYTLQVPYCSVLIPSYFLIVCSGGSKGGGQMPPNRSFPLCLANFETFRTFYQIFIIHAFLDTFYFYNQFN